MATDGMDQSTFVLPSSSAYASASRAEREMREQVRPMREQRAGHLYDNTARKVSLAAHIEGRISWV